MKFTALVFCLLLSFWNASAQNKTLDELFARYKEKGCFSLDLSGNFLSSFVKFEDANDAELKNLVHSIDNIKMINIPNDVHVFSSSTLHDLIKSMRKDAFEDMISVKDTDGILNVLIKESKGNVKEMVVLTASNDGMLIFSFTGNIPKSKVMELTESIKIN